MGTKADMNELVKVTVFSPGSYEECIPSSKTDIELGMRPNDLDDADREFIVSKLKELFGQLWGDYVHVDFSDKCELCGGNDHNSQNGTDENCQAMRDL